MEAKNDVRPFEEYKEMIQDMSKDNMIRGLYDLSANINEKINKIENKDKVINELLKRISDLEFEVERLEKEHEEARTYIHINYPVCFGKDLLEILKGVDKE